MTMRPKRERYILGKKWGYLQLKASVIKNLPANAGAWVQSLGREDSLEKEMAVLSNIIAWKIPWTEESGGL